jgi:hypothetical protein
VRFDVIDVEDSRDVAAAGAGVRRIAEHLHP